jgi:hypothetical protein
MSAGHVIFFPFATGSATHVLPYAGAITVEVIEFMIVLQYTYPKSFIHESDVSPRKIAMQEIEWKHVALTFYEISVRIFLMQQQD